MRKHKRWTPIESKSLSELHRAGKSDTEIAHLLGRSKESVACHRKHKLGIDIRKYWSADEETHLETLLTTTDLPLSEVAKRMNRSEGSVQRRKDLLGIRRVPFKLDRFDPSHVAQLIKFKMAGWTQKRIANVWGLKNQSQISNVLRGHGFHRFRACYGKKSHQQWSEVEIHLLRKALKKGVPRSEIYRQFSYRSPSSIDGKARQITKYWLSPAEQAERQRLREKHKKWRVY